MSNSRRSFLQGGASLAAMGALGGGMLGNSSVAKAAAADAAQGGGQPLNLRQDGGYETVELAKQAITLTLVQSRVHSFAANEWKAGMKRNLAHMLHLIDSAHYMGKPDILQFHEFPLSGWRKWTRKEILNFAIEFPGREIEAIAAKAREYGTWIVFGAYAKDPDWPGHVLSLTTIVNDKGEVVDKQWKARNLKAAFPGFELFTTTIYDVLDQYVEMYGRDAVIPVVRTPLGNIATSSSQMEPELFRAMAVKGAEIVLRTASGGFNPMDVIACAAYNKFYSSIVNNSISPDNGPYLDDPGSGGTAIYGPDGKPLAEAQSKQETLVTARIPIGEFRARRRQPVLHMDLYRDIYAGYQAPFAPNLWTEYTPDSLEDAARYVSGKSRWK